MARKPAINVEALADLGTTKLAQLVLDETGRNPAFRKLVSAAMAGTKGPEAVAKLIDQKLAALERSKSFIDWDKEKTFRQDLSTIVEMIAAELGPPSPLLAIDRLLRFTVTHVGVFERVDDSHGRMQDVYYHAIAAIGGLSALLSDDDAALLPGKVMERLGKTSHGYLVDVAQAVARHLPEAALRTWDGSLIEWIAEENKPNNGRDWRSPQWRRVRQIIAEALGDLDGIVALESEKPAHSQDPIGIATKLLDAGRASEALTWIRKKKIGGLRYMDAADLADGMSPHDPSEIERVTVEAKILTALGDKTAAQALRLSTYENLLNVAILKDYIAALDDFEEFAALDKAFAHATQSKEKYRALELFVEWPRIDLAAELVMRHANDWDGGYYYMLPDVANDLERDYPVAATVLYRALINDILQRGRSKAYGHASRYLAKLKSLAPRIKAEQLSQENIEDHEAYDLRLRKAHGRKSGFWSLVTK